MGFVIGILAGMVVACGVALALFVFLATHQDE